MNVNIVPSEKSGWIISRIIEELKLHNGWTVSSFDYKADLNLFINYHAALPYLREIEASTTKTSAFFTHPEDSFFYYLAGKVDFPIFMSKKYATSQRSWVIPLGVDDVFIPKLLVGNVGRCYSSGRKGSDILDLINSLEFVEIIYPPKLKTKNQKNWLSELSDYYRRLDYYLVTSLVEGGPMPAAEAKACGCCLIAPNGVGFCDDIADFFYDRREEHSLISLLQTLYRKKCEKREAISQWTWPNFAKKVESVVNGKA